MLNIEYQPSKIYPETPETNSRDIHLKLDGTTLAGAIVVS